MTTFEGIVYGILAGLGEFLPIDGLTHQQAIGQIASLTDLNSALRAALYLGLLLAVFLTYAHDWASMISSAIQTIIYRKAPKTMDERMPIFILVAVLPLAATWRPITEWIASLNLTLTVSGLAMAGVGVILWVLDGWSKKNKNSYDWNWGESLAVGVGLLVSRLPGFGILTALFIAGLLRNFSREATLKFASLVFTPLLAALFAMEWRYAQLSGGVVHTLGWMSFSVATVVCFFSSLLAIATLRKQVSQHGLKLYAGYRIAAGLGVAGWFYLKS